MYALPKSTEVRKPLPKLPIFQKYEFSAAQRVLVDANVSRLDFANAITTAKLPAISEGVDVKGIFVVNAELKSRDFDIKAIELIAKLIPQRIIYALTYDGNVRFAAFHSKLFMTGWQKAENAVLVPVGLNLDAVWNNFISHIGNFTVSEDNSLEEQIKIDDDRRKILSKIDALERQMRQTKQAKKKYELYLEILLLKKKL